MLNGFSFDLNFGFDVFFLLSDGYLFGDIKSTPPPNADWDTIALQPDPSLPDDGRYDAVALVNNASLANAFVVTFIWRGIGSPGSQPFAIFDDTFAVTDEGRTIAAGGTTPIPEPTTVVLLLSGVALLWGANATNVHSIGKKGGRHSRVTCPRSYRERESRSSECSCRAGGARQ